MTVSKTPLYFLLALLRIPGIGPIKIEKLLHDYPDLNRLFDENGYCAALNKTAHFKRVAADLAWAEQPNRFILTKEHAHYPALLKEIHSAPPVLFVEGNLSLLSKPQIALVGSRNPTPFGIENAFKFAQHFSSLGFTITSGLAVGIDKAAHQGALQGKGGTIAVLGSGLDCIYPTAHRTLTAEILDKGGALVSEFPIGTPPMRSHFPRRNRIISGLSRGVLVVEATLNSGSLITAKVALEQGREVFAMPGSIHNPLAKGCHDLIRQGATLVETAEDILSELSNFKYVMQPLVKTVDKQTLSAVQSGISAAHEALLLQVGYDSTPIDVVVARSGLTAKAVSIMLLELELRGLVASVPGGYARVLM